MSWINRTETETAGAVGGGHRRVRASLAFGLTAVLLGAAAACTAPPEPPPACPARQQVVLEPTDPVAFSLARAVSPNGAHMVLSRVLGSDLVLSLARLKTHTRDIISILRAVKAAGALHAELVVQ